MLTVVYNDLIMESAGVTEKDLQDLNHNSFILKRPRSFKALRHFLMRLAKLHVVESMKSYSRQRKYKKQAPFTEPSSQKMAFTFENIFPRHQTPPHTETRFPTSYETPQDTKRKISEISFGAQSTHSTPKKLVQAEARVQGLQNAFVNDIIDALWGKGIDLLWVKERRMYLQYAE